MEGYRVSKFQFDYFFCWIVIWVQSWKNLACSWRRQFWLIFGKTWSVMIFEPYEEWSWNFQHSILFMKASYGLSFNKIWGVSHGYFRNSWWFNMEWPFCFLNNIATQPYFSHTLFQYFQWKKNPAVPYFNISNGINT